MGWKNWPYWVRGGLVGLIFYILSFPLAFGCAEGDSLFLCDALYQIYAFNFVAYILRYLNPNALATFLGAFGSMFLYVVFLGAIIGLIIGKFRKKTDENERR